MSVNIHRMSVEYLPNVCRISEIMSDTSYFNRISAWLGPKVCCRYSQPKGDIIKMHNLSYHSYADDTQIYMTFNPRDINFKIAADNIQNCISEVVSWMEQNFLKLNKDKTELIVFTSKHRQDLCNTLNIKIENNLAVPKLYVKDLGVTPDNAF